MKLIPHPTGFSLPVENHDSAEEKAKMKKHGDLLPNSIRALFVGPSNCGKTNALLSLLIHPNGLRFENVYLFSKSRDQPKYQKLREILQPLEGINYYEFGSADEFSGAVNESKRPKPNSIFIFDDLVGSNHIPIMQYFSYARHYGVDCFYLGQTYSRVPKQLVRDNANFIALFKQDDLNLKHAYEDHVSADVSWPEFKQMCSVCWKQPHGFIVIDKDSNHFRKGFDMIFDK